jgi:ribosome-associated toxin RatA of RatAB toxin-antitoxin module
MATEINSKHSVVSRTPAELFMAFTDMRNFVNFIPEDKRNGVTADFDTLKAVVQGFTVGVKITERKPYSTIEVEDAGAPFAFHISIHFDPAEEPGKTDFHIEFSAELNLMMKMLLRSKLQEALD